MILLVAVLAGMAVSAHAQNLVANPGFETADYTDWALTGNTAFTGVTDLMPHSGDFSSQMGPVGSDGFLDQILPTTIGQNYTVSFFLANTDDSGGPDDFSASFGGVTGYSVANPGAFDYTQISFNVTATSSSSDLNFAFSNSPAYWFLDDVSVTANAVPEPTTLALLSLMGVGAIGVRQWRKRKAA